MDPTRNPDDIYVGLSVQSFNDFGAPPQAAIVVGTGEGGVPTLWIMQPESYSPQIKTAYHRNDERAEAAINRGEEDVCLWDFTPTLQAVSDARTATEEAGKKASKEMDALSQARRKLAASAQ